jgi:hypothetical protein
MSQLLRQSTTVTVQAGPFVDKADGVTEKTALSPALELSKAGAAFAARNSGTAVTHDQNGWYRVELNATDTNTAGPLVVKSDDAAAHLAVWHEFMVVPAAVYDSLVAGTDKLQVDVAEWLGTGPNALVSGRVDGRVGAVAAGAIDAAAVATGAIDADALAADAAQEIADTLRSRTLTEGYAADGAAPTLEQALFEILAVLEEMAISGTTVTVRRRDGSTTALTLALNDAANPTSITRTS